MSCKHSTIAIPPDYHGSIYAYVCSRGDRENHAELQKQFLGFAIDIASAMVYLSGKKFVHRDLAARNILLDAHMKCRVLTLYKHSLLDH